MQARTGEGARPAQVGLPKLSVNQLNQSFLAHIRMNKIVLWSLLIGMFAMNGFIES